MELQVVEGTLAEVQRQLRDLPCTPDDRLRLVVTWVPAPVPSTLGHQPFRPVEFRNGVPLLPRRQIGKPVTLEVVKRLLDEDDLELLYADRIAGHQCPAGNDRPDAPPP